MMSSGKAKPVVVFGVKYESLSVCWEALGEVNKPPSLDRYRKKLRIDDDNLLVETIFLGFQKSRQTKAKQIENKKKEMENKISKALERKQIALNREVQGPYSRIGFCQNCSLAFPKAEKYQSYCSSDCKNIHTSNKIKQNRKAVKQELRAKGLDNRGKPRKRHRKHGGIYDPTVTAKSVAITFGMICQVCFKRVEPHKGKGWQPLGWTVGHIVAVSDGGDTTWGNVQCECMGCNSNKGTKPLGQMNLFTDRINYRQTMKHALPIG